MTNAGEDTVDSEAVKNALAAEHSGFVDRYDRGGIGSWPPAEDLPEGILELRVVLAAHGKIASTACVWKVDAAVYARVADAIAKCVCKKARYLGFEPGVGGGTIYVEYDFTRPRWR